MNVDHLPTVLKSGALARLEEGARDIVLREMRSLRIEAGRPVFRAGDHAVNFLMVKEGAVRVSVFTEQGREIVLYRVEPGETCVLTTSCLLSGADYDADAVAEDATEAIILPKAAFEELLATSARFRQFVFSTYGERLGTLISLVQEISLRHVDRRLARFLVQQGGEGPIHLTHQAMAGELGTAREVVTRLLNDFADRNWLRLARGQVAVLDQAALEEYARGV